MMSETRGRETWQIWTSPRRGRLDNERRGARKQSFTLWPERDHP